MSPIESVTLPPADAEQAHLIDEIIHPEFVEAVRLLAQRCSDRLVPSARLAPLR